MSNSKIERWTPELQRWLETSARNAGFDAVGVAAVREAGDPVAEQEAARFTAWVDAGHAGEMEYLKRRDEEGALLRGTLRTAMPWARSVIVCALNYNADAPVSIDPAPPGAGWIARYAWSGRTLDDGTCAPTDYHNELHTRLRRIETELLAHAACSTRCYVDTGPMVERALAVQAGLGWTGKNTCLLNQQLGSWLLLGVIVTSLPVEEQMAEQPHEQLPSAFALPAADRCGTCTRCIDACPTGALLGGRDPAAPREMDASLCIAYLTIEKKGTIDEALRAPMGRQVFGCDICQDVCPWNTKTNSKPHGQTNSKAHSTVPSATVDGMRARPELINPALDWLAAMDAREFRRRFKGSPLERTGRKRLLRNIAIAMGNSGEPRFLPQLEAWASGGAPGSSISAGENANDHALREAAHWACARILSRSSS